MINKPIEELHVEQNKLPWKVLMEGMYFKLLRTCSVTGAYVLLMRHDPGTFVPSHKHFGSAEYYMLKGKTEVRGGVENGGVTASAGDYGYEPNGVIHEQTYFPELTEYLFINHGPLHYIDDDGNIISVLDWQAVEALWESSEIAEVQ